MHHQFTQKGDAISEAFLWLLLGHDKHNTSFENIQSKLLSPKGISGCFRRLSLRLQVKFACKTNKLAFLIKTLSISLSSLLLITLGNCLLRYGEGDYNVSFLVMASQHSRLVCVSSDKTIFQLEIKRDKSAG